MLPAVYAASAAAPLIGMMVVRYAPMMGPRLATLLTALEARAPGAFQMLQRGAAHVTALYNDATLMQRAPSLWRAVAMRAPRVPTPTRIPSRESPFLNQLIGDTLKYAGLNAGKDVIVMTYDGLSSQIHGGTFHQGLVNGAGAGHGRNSMLRIVLPEADGTPSIAYRVYSHFKKPDQGVALYGPPQSPFQSSGNQYGPPGSRFGPPPESGKIVITTAPKG